MKKRQIQKRSIPKCQITRLMIKHAAKCTAMAVAAILAVQPCFTLTAHGYWDEYDSYPYWDDPDYSSYYRGGGERKVTGVTRTYDDGTKYTSQYEYNDAGDLVYSDIKTSDGSRSTTKRSYSDGGLNYETTHTYDANTGTESSETAEYGGRSFPIHKVESEKYSDGTTQTSEEWYHENSQILKAVQKKRDGTTIQADFTYNERGDSLTTNMVSSDGSFYQEERRYDENGEGIYYKSSEYDAADQTSETQERSLIREGESYLVYEVDVLTDSSGDHKEETWYKEGDYRPIKKVTTEPGGLSTTENYSYNMDGEETLYTSVGSDGTTKRRETTYTREGEKTVETDGKGNTVISSETYDEVSGRTTEEETRQYADGSSKYTKYVYQEYSMVIYIRKEKTADGTEIYKEVRVEEDGITTTTEKKADGAVSVTKEDAHGDLISCHITLPDGTSSDRIQTRMENGLLANEVTRYSDGGEDRIDYEYNEKGELIKETETRRNGVGAVTEYQKQTNHETATTTFNNGRQVTVIADSSVENHYEASITYSAGDIAQHIIIMSEDRFTVKTIYRDGRTEEASVDDSNGDLWYAMDELEDHYQEYFEDYLEQAWMTVPAQDGAKTQTGETI